MKQETADYLAKAREDLDEARNIAGIGLANAAGRSAYYAAFHTAEALIMERNGRAALSHKGVRIEFARLTREEPRLGEFTTFLTRAYDLKAFADYSITPKGRISLADAQAAIEEAERMLARVVDFLSSSTHSGES
ncbi:MAG TPA: HEPN domain-containing protein [Methylocella sp.]|nr:HEPN domain-containing protein [Methylocella sp.]